MTGVQTCALPIYRLGADQLPVRRHRGGTEKEAQLRSLLCKEQEPAFGRQNPSKNHRNRGLPPRRQVENRNNSLRIPPFFP